MELLIASDENQDGGQMLISSLHNRKGDGCNNCLCNNHGLCNVNRLRNKKSTARVITTACVIKNQPLV